MDSPTEVGTFTLKTFTVDDGKAPAQTFRVALHHDGTEAEADAFAKDVEKIVTKVGDFTIRSLCILSDRKYRPQTHVDAQFSLPYTVGVAIVRGRTGVAEFKGDTLKDPEVLALTDKVTWELDPAAEALWPKAYPATLVVTLKDGRVLQAHADFPKGDPENPVSMDEVVEKFDHLTEGFLPRDKARELVALARRVETLSDVSVLADLAR